MREDGFTLIELLVSAMILLAVLAGALTAFQHAIVLNDTGELTADSSQNLRAAINLIARDLMQAGRGIPTGGVPIPSGAGSGPIVRPGPDGTNDAFDNVDATTLPAIVPGPAMGPVVSGLSTDMVTILVSDPTLPSLTLNPTPAVNGQPTLASNGASLNVGSETAWVDDPQSAVQAGDLILFSNALGDAIQMVTGVRNKRISFATGDALNLNQRNAAGGSLMELETGGAFPQTTATRILMLTYYVDDSSPASPRLVRRVNAGPATPLAGIIEDLEFTFDLVDGDTNPVGLKAPVAPDTPNQIRKVNFHVGVRSDTRATPKSDYLHEHISTVVSVRNLAFVNRYP